MHLPEILTQETITALYRNGFLRTFNPTQKNSFDLAHVTRVDGAGVAFLWWLRARCEACGGQCVYEHLSLSVDRQLAAYADAHKQAPVEVSEPPTSYPERIGATTCEIFRGLYDVIAYVGALLYHLVTLFAGHFRWSECREAFYRAGVQAVPVVMMIGFLLGLILAFQSAIPLEMFGAEGFVGGLVGIALVRELGLIITAILMAGRTGSAFAAEIGTMKVNEELDALETMGLYPVRFLALPRVIAGTLALPLLSLFATFAGLVGGWLVMSILGFSVYYYLDQLIAFVAVGDLLGSLAKAVVFGFAVSAVGCRCGLTAGNDASGVGRATTSAVVTGIVLVAVLEGVFAVLFYAMGW